jgi:hypothetical protein
MDAVRTRGAPLATSFVAVVVKVSRLRHAAPRAARHFFRQPRLSSWGAGWPPIVATLAVLTMEAV